MIGSPSMEDIYNMSISELKFDLPKIKPIVLNKYFVKHNPNADAHLINLLTRIFVYDPTKRLTPEKALMDPYFNSCR